MITIDITKAKEVWKDKIRNARKSALAKLDIDFIIDQQIYLLLLHYINFMVLLMVLIGYLIIQQQH